MALSAKLQAALTIGSFFSLFIWFHQTHHLFIPLPLLLHHRQLALGLCGMKSKSDGENEQ
jgi:hypothetical protein